jgi:hypothetical protein
LASVSSRAGDYKHLQPSTVWRANRTSARTRHVVKRSTPIKSARSDPLIRAHVGPYTAAVPREESGP